MPTDLVVNIRANTSELEAAIARASAFARGGRITRELGAFGRLLPREEDLMEEQETTVRWSVALDDPNPSLRDYQRNSGLLGRGSTPTEAADDLKRQLDEIAEHANGNLDAVERSVDVLKKSQRVAKAKR